LATNKKKATLNAMTRQKHGTGWAIDDKPEAKHATDKESTDEEQMEMG
jgi:hypothetical protein